jgi:hypothetical protein
MSTQRRSCSVRCSGAQSWLAKRSKQAERSAKDGAQHSAASAAAAASQPVARAACRSSGAQQRAAVELAALRCVAGLCLSCRCSSALLRAATSAIRRFGPGAACGGVRVWGSSQQRAPVRRCPQSESGGAPRGRSPGVNFSAPRRVEVRQSAGKRRLAGRARGRPPSLSQTNSSAASASPSPSRVHPPAGRPREEERWRDPHDCPTVAAAPPHAGSSSATLLRTGA